MLSRGYLLLRRFEKQVVNLARLRLRVIATIGDSLLKLRHAGIEVGAINAQNVDFQRRGRLSCSRASAGLRASFRECEEVDVFVRLREIEQGRFRVGQQSRRARRVERFALSAQRLQIRATCEESVSEGGVIFLRLAQFFGQIIESNLVRTRALHFTLNPRVEGGDVGKEFTLLLALARRYRFGDP